MEKWKEHYSNMDPRSKDEYPTWGNLYPASKQKDTVVKKATAPLIMNKKDIKILLIVKEILRRHTSALEQRQRARTITQVDKAEFAIQPDTLEFYLHRLLSESEAPMHIQEIIPQIEALGWKSASTYHKYAQVHKALSHNDYMFLRMGKAVFKLRDGFRNTKPAKEEKKLTDRIRYPKNYIPTLLDVIVSITERYQTPLGIYPARVHYILQCMGNNAPCYSTVYRTMQCDTFIRNGNWYKINDARKCSDENAS